MYLLWIFLLVLGWEAAAAWSARVSAHAQRNLQGLLKVAGLSALVGVFDIGAFLWVVYEHTLWMIIPWVIGSAIGEVIGIFLAGDVPLNSSEQK